jgi:hypothetical protein
MRKAAGSTRFAASTAGPMGVNPSPPFERRFEPLSAYLRSYTPKSLAAVIEETQPQPSSGATRRAALPMTSAISPSKASSSHPTGRSIGVPDAESEVDGLRK